MYSATKARTCSARAVTGPATSAHCLFERRLRDCERLPVFIWELLHNLRHPKSLYLDLETVGGRLQGHIGKPDILSRAVSKSGELLVVARHRMHHFPDGFR